jgi:hypothetical protein
VPSQQPQGQLQTQHSVDKNNYFYEQTQHNVIDLLKVIIIIIIIIIIIKCWIWRTHLSFTDAFYRRKLWNLPAKPSKPSISQENMDLCKRKPNSFTYRFYVYGNTLKDPESLSDSEIRIRKARNVVTFSLRVHHTEISSKDTSLSNWKNKPM